MPRPLPIGEKFGMLTVLEFVRKDRHFNIWVRARCDCGNESTPLLSQLRSGHTQSCGCQLTAYHNSLRKHGKSKMPECVVWRGMVHRCHNPKSQSFKDYGEKGITVCDRWRNSFEAFLEDMGPRPSAKYSIERKNNRGNYEPDNCIWATKEVQNNNRGNTRFFEFQGRKQTLRQWSNELGIPFERLCSRIQQGWSIERALTTPKLINQNA